MPCFHNEAAAVVLSRTAKKRKRGGGATKYGPQNKNGSIEPFCWTKRMPLDETLTIRELLSRAKACHRKRSIEALSIFDAANIETRFELAIGRLIADARDKMPNVPAIARPWTASS